MSIQETMHHVYYMAALDGAILEKNRVTLYRHRGLSPRWQVYSERAGKKFDEVFIELDAAVDNFMELSQ